MIPGTKESIASIVDITPLKGAEEELRKSEERIRTLIQRIQAAVVVHSSDTSIEMSNSTAERLLGLTEDQMMGKKFIEREKNLQKK